MADWVDDAWDEIEDDGTEGAFTRQARRAGYDDTFAFAQKVMDGWRSGRRRVYNKREKRYQGITEKTMRRANFLINQSGRRANPTGAMPDPQAMSLWLSLFKFLKDVRVDTTDGRLTTNRRYKPIRVASVEAPRSDFEDPDPYWKVTYLRERGRRGSFSELRRMKLHHSSYGGDDWSIVVDEKA